MKESYQLRRADQTEAALLHQMMCTVSEGMSDPSWYLVNPLADVQEHLENGGFAVLAQTEDGEPAGCLLCYVPLTEEENLGAASFAGQPVYLMDTVVVLPAHRGHGLQQRMLAAAQELIGTPCCLMATVSPYNAASLRSFEKTGYRILETKEKYGGYLRHVMYKEWNR